MKNIVRKGEIACYKQFLLFSQCFPQLNILKSQYRPTRVVFVYKIHANPIHTITKYGNYYDFTDS